MTDNKFTDCNRFGRSIKTLTNEKAGQGHGLGLGEGETNMSGKSYGFGWAADTGDETGASEC